MFIFGVLGLRIRVLEGGSERSGDVGDVGDGGGEGGVGGG